MVCPVVWYIGDLRPWCDDQQYNHEYEGFDHHISPLFKWVCKLGFHVNTMCMHQARMAKCLFSCMCWLISQSVDMNATCLQNNWMRGNFKSLVTWEGKLTEVCNICVHARICSYHVRPRPILGKCCKQLYARLVLCNACMPQENDEVFCKVQVSSIYHIWDPKVMWDDHIGHVPEFEERLSGNQLCWSQVQLPRDHWILTYRFFKLTCICWSLRWFELCTGMCLVIRSNNQWTPELQSIEKCHLRLPVAFAHHLVDLFRVKGCLAQLSGGLSHDIFDLVFITRIPNQFWFSWNTTWVRNVYLKVKMESWNLQFETWEVVCPWVAIASDWHACQACQEIWWPDLGHQLHDWHGFSSCTHT